MEVAINLEISKIKQYLKLSEVGIGYPETVASFGTREYSGSS